MGAKSHRSQIWGRVFPTRTMTRTMGWSRPLSVSHLKLAWGPNYPSLAPALPQSGRWPWRNKSPPRLNSQSTQTLSGLYSRAKRESQSFLRAISRGLPNMLSLWQSAKFSIQAKTLGSASTRSQWSVHTNGRLCIWALEALTWVHPASATPYRWSPLLALVSIIAWSSTRILSYNSRHQTSQLLTAGERAVPWARAWWWWCSMDKSGGLDRPLVCLFYPCKLSR